MPDAEQIRVYCGLGHGPYAPGTKVCPNCHSDIEKYGMTAEQWMQPPVASPRGDADTSQEHVLTSRCVVPTGSGRGAT